ncbi:radical SAM/SPASM domain-containing protein [Haliovirga abyssi]|uniref:Radical SAM protein n=1 Tax=Haliovirga abyssi TaxID=2996794 RepID=A0AAU9DNF1_9FUSO|nr:radical SAM protein [Haliovirga abyssi]BDU51597.1 radical SAM protein [Haliovirga abyssi]
MKEKKIYIGTDSVMNSMLSSIQEGIIKHQSNFFKVQKFTEDLVHNRTYVNCMFPSFPGRAWDRFFEGTYRVSKGENVPLWMDIVVTGRCHCNCWHCFRSSYKDNGDLEIEVIKRTIDEAYEAGTTVIGITGGEPMLRDDILDILKLIPDGMEGLFYTTGYKIDNSFAKKLSKTNVTRCLISLDHYDEKIVNTMRGYPKAYEMTMTAIKALKEANIYTGVTLCVTDDLCDREVFYKYINFVRELGADEIRVILPIPQGNLEGKNYKRLYINAMKWTREIHEKSLKNPNYPNILLFSQLESHNFIGCGAGYTYVTINNDGALTPCVCVPLTFGNVKEDGFISAYSKINSLFKGTGKTCYGKRVSKAMKEEIKDGMLAPYNEEVSKKIANKCIVNDGIAKFYDNLKNYEVKENDA